MIKFAQNELLSMDDFSKQIEPAINSIKIHSLEKIGILKNNKLAVVVISSDEYQRLKDTEEQAEYTEISNMTKHRRATPLSEYISEEDMAKKFSINLK